METSGEQPKEMTPTIRIVENKPKINKVHDDKREDTKNEYGHTGSAEEEHEDKGNH